MKKTLLLIAVFAGVMLTGSIYFNPFQGKVKIIIDGKISEYDIKNATVYEALKKAGVSLSSHDIVFPALNTYVCDGMHINVIRVKESTVKVREVLNFGTVNVYDPNLSKEESVVLEYGKDGYIEKEFKVLFHNEREVWRKLYNINAVEKPKNIKLVMGTDTKKRMYMMPKKMWAVKVYTMKATGYYPGPEDCGIYADGLTANGMKAGYGVVAVDPKTIPLGTKLYIPTYGYAIAADTGGAINGQRIDLCFNTYKESSTYTPRWLKVYVIK
ncbi:MAG: 3D domain-containing protein [Candidatus Firestonebacteria bacterium]